MTKSSRSRRSRAKGKKRASVTSNALTRGVSKAEGTVLPTLSRADKVYMAGFALLSFIVTVFYWSLGGRNLFVFPALFCISVGARKYWSGPLRRLAGDT